MRVRQAIDSTRNHSPMTGFRLVRLRALMWLLGGLFACGPTVTDDGTAQDSSGFVDAAAGDADAGVASPPDGAARTDSVAPADVPDAADAPDVPALADAADGAASAEKMLILLVILPEMRQIPVVLLRMAMVRVMDLAAAKLRLPVRKIVVDLVAKPCAATACAPAAYAVKRS